MLYNLSNNLVAFDYCRIIYGGRGEYIEFDECSLNWDIIFIPNNQKMKNTFKFNVLWLHSNLTYYDEYRTNDKSYVKIYYQRAKVSYADCKIGFYYISVYNIVDLNDQHLIYKEENPFQYFF
jgi:hypothetical protein